MNAVPKILIVEDEPDLRGVYTDALSGDGYQLDTAVDGDEAVQKILQGGWDLILLDIVMPKKNGFDVLETVRRTIIDPAQKQQLMDSIIFMTNLDNMADLTHALSLGPKEYVVKTQVTPGQVQELVRSFLEKKTSHPSVLASQQASPEAATSVSSNQISPSPTAFSLPAAPIQPDLPPVLEQPILSQQPQPSQSIPDVLPITMPSVQPTQVSQAAHVFPQSSLQPVVQSEVSGLPQQSSSQDTSTDQTAPAVVQPPSQPAITQDLAPAPQPATIENQQENKSSEEVQNANQQTS